MALILLQITASWDKRQQSSVSSTQAQVEHLTGNQKVAMLLKKKRGESAEAVLAAAAAAAAATEESSRKRAKAVKIETSAAAVVSSKLNQDSFNPMYLLRGEDWDPRSATEGNTDDNP
jgi:hypothetical protein